MLILVGGAVGLFALGACVLGTCLAVSWGMKTGNDGKKDDRAALDKKKDGPEEPPPPPPHARQSEIDEAIARGTAYLQMRMQDGKALYSASGFGGESHIGAAALTGLTLLESGVPPDDPGVVKALSLVRLESATLSKNYVVACSIFFLNRLHEANPLSDADRRMHKNLVLRLVSGQQTNGQFGYNCPPLAPTAEQNLFENLQGNTYQPNSRFKDGNNSQTQFAILALWGSRRLGIPVTQPLLAAASHFRKTQTSTGVWTYNQKVYLGDSSTSAGLIALAIERGLNPAASENRNFLQDPAVAKGFKHLGTVLDKTTKSPRSFFKADAGGDLYFLWTVERVGVIYDLPEIEGKNWYDRGMEIILANQKKDGSWAERYIGVPDTCFAMLFLMRANMAKDLTETLRSRN